MADDYQVVFSADDRDLINSYLQQTDKIQKLQLELKKWQKEAMEAGRASEKAAKEGAAGADRMIKGVAGIAAGWLSASGAVSAYMATNKEAIVESERHAEVLDDIVRKFRIQSGMSAMQGDDAKRAILKNAYRSGVTKDQAFAAGTQLVSSGMEADEAKAGGLKAFLDVLGASNQTGKSVDSEGLSKALMQYLESQGMAKTGANVAQIGGQVQALFKGTNLQLSGLPALAKEGAGLAGAMSPQEQLAAFAKLTGSFDESTSATSLRNYVQRLQTAGSKKDASASLKKMGLRPEDVDFVGENFDTVTGKLSEGLENVPEKDRAGVLKSIFEEAGIAPAKALMNGRADFAKNLALQQDLTGFQADVKLSQQGRGAASRRHALENEIGLAETAQNYGDTAQAMRNSMRKYGESPARLGLATMGFNLAASVGASPEQSLSFAMPTGEMGNLQRQDARNSIERAQDPDAFLRGQQEEARARAEHTAALRENTAATKAATQIVPKSTPTPVPRPLAGAGRP